MHPSFATLPLLAALLVPAAGAEAAVKPKPVRAKLTLEADHARLQAGRLHLTGIAPRMTIATRKRRAVAPAGMLAAGWKPLFRRSRGRADGVLIATVRGKQRRHRVRLRLRARHVSGKWMRFVAKGPHGGRRSLRHVRLVVRPVLDGRSAALQRALFGRVSADGDLPPNPVEETADGGRQFDSGLGGHGRAVWDGPATARVDTGEQRDAVQRQNLDQFGALYLGGLGQPFPNVTFEDGRSGGLALFNRSWGTVSINNATVTNLALFDSDMQRLAMDHADVRGLLMRNASAEGVRLTNSSFEGADMTGATLSGDGAERSEVSNTVFIDVTAAERRVEPYGNHPDAATQRLDEGKGLTLRNVDFSSTTFKDADFSRAEVTSVSFAGCGLQDVKFDGATFIGNDVNDAMRLQPTFENTILDNVSFDGARLKNVSFAGIDFSTGVSLDGAKLENVDFTGAVGLQFVDWTKVEVEGYVWGLTEYGHQLTLDDPMYLRSLSFDGVLPTIDDDTGYDEIPGTSLLMDPASGVRFGRDSFTNEVRPVDPATGEPYRNPRNGNELAFRDGDLYDPWTGEDFEVDYGTGELLR